MYTPNKILGDKLIKISWILSALVLLLVILMRNYKIDLGVDFTFLPPYIAGLNIFVSIALLVALYFIRIKNVEAHRRAIYAAMIASGLFLLAYVLYHFTTVETKFCMEGTKRTVYFVLLLSHIVFAAISLPFILINFAYGYTFQIEKHKRLGKWIFPVWLYVAVSGPICYFMLKPCYL